MAEFKWSQSQNAKYQKKVINQKKKFSQYEADGKDTSKLKVYPDNPIRISRSAESTLEAYVNYRKALREQGLSLEPVVTGAAKVVRTPAEEWAAEKINARPAEGAIQGRAQMTGTKNPLLNVKGIDDLSKYRGKLVPLTSDQVENSAPLSFDRAKDTREYQWASRHPAIAAAVNIGMSPVAGLEGYLNEARSAAGDKKLDANEMRGALIQESLQQGIQKGVRDRLGMQDDGVLDKREQTANFLTGVGLSTVNSLVSAALMPEAAVLAAFSGNAANQALLDAARDENMSKTQATMSAAAQGIAEALFEKWSVENFKVMQAKPVTSIKELAKNLVKSMVGEGSEEFFTDAANDITDYMINGDNSAFMRNFRERVQNGEDPSQARMNALRDRFLSASQSFLAGAISGAGSAAVGSAIGTYTNGKSMQSLAENYAESHSNRNSGSGESYIRKSPKAQAGMYQEIADSIDDSTDEGRIARDAAQNAADRMNRGERLSTVQQGYVANAVDAAAANAAESSNDRDREANNGYGPKPESVPEDVWKEITKEPYNAMSRKARTQMQLAGLSEVERKRTAEKIRSLEQSALKEWGKNYGESGRSAFVENYNASGLNSDQYLKAFNSIYNAGRYGMKQNEMSSAYSALISDQDLFENIFKAGVKDRQRALDRIPKMGYQARQEQRVGGIRDAAPTISDNVKSVFESFGKKTGLEFVLLDSRMGNGISNNAMGSYSGDGVITIDVGNTENILATTSHEMTHWLEAYAPMEYQNFEEAAVRSIMLSKSTTIEKEIAIRRNSGYTGSDEDIIKEIVADSTGTFLNDENFAKEIAAKNHTIAERILDWLSSMIDAIKELISDKGIRSSAKALQEDLENYQKIRETWIGAVEQASEKMKSIELVDGDLDSESIDRTGERFQRKLKESGIDAEVTDSLVAIHNIRPDSMMKILNYSGIPMPSIAVTKAEMGWDKFGEISMVFRRNTIDPAANKKNKVYRGDSWTPTFPKVDYDVDEGVYQSVQKKVASLMEGKEPSFLTQEAKPERVVGWSEIGYVLVPEGTAPELLDKMGERGLETITYDPEIKGDRTEKLKSLEGVRFQLDLDESSPVSMDFLGDKMQGAKQELVSLMEEARGIRPSEASISRLVSGMIKDYHSEADPLYIKNQIMKFYDYMSLHEGIKNEDFGAVAASIGGEIIENATMINEEAEAQWKSFKKDLRSRQIYISPHNVKDVDPEGLSHLNRRFFGKIRFTTDPELMHQDAHTAYSTLHEVYPDILPEDPYGMFDDEAIRLIIDARENGAPLRQRDVPTEAADFNEAAYELGERILNTYFKAASPSLLRSYQETYQKAVKSMQKDISFELAKYRKKLESEVNRKLNLLKKQYAENMYDFREYQMEKGKLEKALEKANLNAAAVRERIRQKNQDYIKRQKKANEIKRIESSMRKIQRMIEQLTNRAHVPAPIAKGIQQLFSVIDLTTDMSGKSDVLRQQDYRRLQNLNFENALQDFKNIVRAVNENGGALVDSETHLTTYITLDPDFLSRLENMERYIESMAKTYKGIPKVRKMSYEQIHELSQLISYIRHFLDYANRFTSMDIDETIGVFAERTFSDLRERTAPKTYDSKTAPMRSFFQKMAQEGMLDSPTFFNLIGPSGDRIYNTLRAGLNKKTVSMDKSMRYIDEMMSEFGVDTKDFRKWDTKVREITIHGKKVKVTDAQIMELYVLNHREQARKHIYGNKENMDSTRVNGGIQFSGVGVKGILEKVQAPIRYLTGSNIESIISILTPQQKQVAESMQRFLSGYMSQLGNETSMNLYGYEKFTESNYWPIHTMSEFRDTRTTDIEKGMTTLENMGWTKTITQKAQNPLKIGSIFDTFVEHVDKMTSYNAYLPGLTDLRKWFNYQDAYMSMKSKLAEHMGENALEYINHLIQDLNGSRGRADSWGMFSENLVSRAKGVAVAANPSVWIQQPFSIVRAAAEIDPKYILQALEPAQLAKRKEEWKNCREYAPIAKWKEFGGPDIGTGQSVKQLLFGNANKIEDFREFSMKPAEMGDRLTWCTLWMAAENQVRAEQKRLSPGTSEFYQAAAKIFDHVIDFTQVVDSPLHRTEMMKSKNPIAQLATAFQSEPQKTYDMLYREVYKAKQGDAEARKRIYTTILILACNIIATNAGKALAQALKDKDKDKRYGERWRDAFLSDIGVGGIVEALDPESDAAVQERIGGAVSGYALSDMSPLSYFPYIKDVLETFINNISGKGYRDSDLSNQNLTDLITGAKALLDLASGDTKKGVMGTAYAASSAAHIKGIPLKNAMRYVGAAIDEMLYAIDTDATRRLRYKRNQLMLNEGNESNVQQFIREALKSYAAGDAALGDKIISDLLEHGIDEEKLESRMASMLSKEPEFAEAAEAKAGRNDGVYQDARKMLLDKGYSEELVDSKLESRVKSEIRKNAPYTGTEIAEILYQQQEGYQNSLQLYSDYLKEHYGKTDKEIRASLKGSLTNQYKPLYEKASTAEKSEIMRNLYRIRYKGKQLYETKDFQRWNKK